MRLLVRVGTGVARRRDQDSVTAAGARLRAGKIDLLEEMQTLYASLNPPFAPKIAELRAHEPVLLADWEVSDYVELGGPPSGRWFRLESDDSVVEVRPSGVCDAGPGRPCSLDHEHYVTV